MNIFLPKTAWHRILQNSYSRIRGGFYWLGFDKGYQKYDGVQFTTTLYNDDNIITGLFDESRAAPVEDRFGTVYILHQGVIFINNTKGHVDTIQISDPVISEKSCIMSICKDVNDNIWLATWNNIYHYDYQTRRPELWMKTGPQEPVGSYEALLADKRVPDLWLIKDNLVSQVNTVTKTISKKLELTDSITTGGPMFPTMVTGWMDKQCNLWLSSWNGRVDQYNTLNGQLTHYDPFNTAKSGSTSVKAVVACFAEDGQGNIWIGCASDGALLVYDKATSHVVQVPADNNQPWFLHYEASIFPLYCDREGNIWAGSDKGINVHNAFFQPFTYINETVLGPAFRKPVVNQVFQSRQGEQRSIWPGWATHQA